MQPDFANDVLLRHFARDCAAPFVSRQTLALLVTVAVFLALIGPFGTYGAYAPAMRLLYWGMIVIGTASIGHATATAIERFLRCRNVPVFVEIFAVSALTAIPVCLVVSLIWALFGTNPLNGDMLPLYGQCVVAIGCLTVFFHIFAAPAITTKEWSRPKLLDRLPLHTRGRILRLTARDHYVEVETERGSALLAMRFRDAVSEAAGEKGVQTHRSHWVALHAVTGRSRLNGRTVLLLKNGHEVPVGRTFRAAVENRMPRK
ncbi:LytTR family DNA-binding domain-containing protein [uncultured Roseibium sp.]|uniref:LytTR family DNA-binding domain-containing protein n=1 Tax=uncultured Roseibium sp. TaxID=1936171 RepID=UPI002613F803|nr:LytTR family DNA-binding domain-containing protein [uncultured Roseibium sp.]